MNTMENKTKDEIIAELSEAVSKTALYVFKSLELETFIEVMIIDDLTGKEYVFSFQTVDEFKKKVSHVDLSASYKKVIEELLAELEQNKTAKAFRWTVIKSKDDLPKEKGFYECWHPESEMFHEGHSEFWFDGENFRDGDSLRLWTDLRMYGRRITKYISHYMKITAP